MGCNYKGHRLDIMKIAVRAWRFSLFISRVILGMEWVLKSLTVKRMPNKNDQKCFPQEMCFGQFSCWKSVFFFSLIVLTEFQSLDSELMVSIERAV